MIHKFNMCVNQRVLLLINGEKNSIRYVPGENRNQDLPFSQRMLSQLSYVPMHIRDFSRVILISQMQPDPGPYITSHIPHVIKKNAY